MLVWRNGVLRGIVELTTSKEKQKKLQKNLLTQQKKLNSASVEFLVWIVLGADGRSCGCQHNYKTRIDLAWAGCLQH
jgi:hypothetical protein